jgi:hypothetical protein
VVQTNLTKSYPSRKRVFFPSVSLPSLQVGSTTHDQISLGQSLTHIIDARMILHRGNLIVQLLPERSRGVKDKMSQNQTINIERRALWPLKSISVDQKYEWRCPSPLIYSVLKLPLITPSPYAPHEVTNACSRHDSHKLIEQADVMHRVHYRIGWALRHGSAEAVARRKYNDCVCSSPSVH